MYYMARIRFDAPKPRRQKGASMFDFHIPDWVKEWFGPLAFGVVGRLMFHVGEVNAGRRSLFGPELLFDIPILFGMVSIGGLIADLLNIKPGSTAFYGVITFAAWGGPKLLEGLWAAVQKRLGGESA